MEIVAREEPARESEACAFPFGWFLLEVDGDESREANQYSQERQEENTEHADPQGDTKMAQGLLGN